VTVSSTIPLSGRLDEHPLSAVLRSILDEKRDGRLVVSRGAVSRWLYLREGMIVSVGSNERLDRLGEILVAQGKITVADLDRSWEESRAENRLLGITLVLNGRITPTDLFLGVSAQAVTILDRLQKWRKGEFVFEEGSRPEPGAVLLRIPLVIFLRPETEKKERKGRAKDGAKRAPRPETPAAPAEEPAAEAVPAVDEPAVLGAEEEEVVFEDDGVEGEILAAAAAAAAAPPVSTGNVFSGGAVPDERDRAAEVAFHVQELRRRVEQGPSVLLGVKPEADAGVVKQAYHGLAKLLHPDRLPPGLPEDVAREAEEIFREITAAFHFLSDQGPSRKADPVAAASPDVRGGRRADADAEQQARRAYFQGREFITKGNFWQGANSLRQAVRLKPEETAFRRLLVLALVQTKRLHEAEEHIQEAIRLEPSNADNFVTLGRVYSSGRLYRKAREAYERALKIDRRNEAAREELRGLPEEPPAEKAGGGGSFFKKLFGKG
jgi:curved DNA-binding protein CbpA